MKFLALVAIAAAVSLEDTEERKLGKKAKNEAATYAGFEAAQALVFKRQKAYLARKATARHEEKELQREINETDAQEAKTNKANAAALKARKAVHTASFAAHKAFEAYMNAMAGDKLVYSR